MANAKLGKTLREVQADAEEATLERIADWKRANPEKAQELEDSLAETLELTKARQDTEETESEKDSKTKDEDTK